MPKFQEKGFSHIILLLLILAIILLAVLIWKGVVKNPLSSLIKKEPTLSLQTKYDNPFDKSSQYVNPFASYKNPFDNLRIAK